MKSFHEISLYNVNKQKETTSLFFLFLITTSQFQISHTNYIISTSHVAPLQVYLNQNVYRQSFSVIIF